MDVARQPIELRDDDGAFTSLGLGQSGGELGAAIEGVGALARLHLHVFANALEALGLSEAGDSGALRLDAQAGLALARRADPDVRDERFYGLSPQAARRLYARLISCQQVQNRQNRRNSQAKRAQKLGVKGAGVLD